MSNYNEAIESMKSKKNDSGDSLAGILESLQNMDVNYDEAYDYIIKTFGGK